MPTRTLPLFPLNTVLFPGGLLPLQIFEPRYRQMIGECMEGDRLFGVCLIRRGEEVGEPAEPYDVGTTAEILRLQPRGEGRYTLVAKGRDRFRIVTLHQGRPYLLAEIEYLPEPPPAEATGARLPELRERLETYIRTLAELLGYEPGELVLPQDAAPLVYLACSLMQLPLNEKQHLLELPDTDARLARVELRLGRLLERAQELAERKRQGVASPFNARAALRRLPLN